MAQYSTPPLASILGSRKEHGVYQNVDPQNPAEEYALVATASDFNGAYEKLLEHVNDSISQRPELGATRSVTSADAKTYEVIGFDNQVRMRYQIEVMRKSDRDEKGEVTYLREHDWLACHSLSSAKVFYGMYTSVDCDNPTNTKDFLMGGYATIGEASQAMKNSARSCLNQRKDALLLETSLELFDAQDKVQQRYQIVRDRWRFGKFEKEKSWLEKEAQIRVGDEGYGSFYVMPNDGDANETPVIHHQQSSQALRLTSRDNEDESPDPAPQTGLYCSCQTPDTDSLMIACENKDYAVQWYHGACVRLTVAPQGKWYCPDCEPNVKRGGKTKTKAKAEGKGKAKARASTGAGVKKAAETGGKKRKSV